MRAKNRSNRGFTLSELLVVLGLTALITAALAAGIPSAMRVYDNVTALSEASLLSSTLAQVVADELRYGENPTQNGDTVTFDSATYGGGVAFASDGGRLTLGGTPLLADDAYPSSLSASLEVDYNSGSGSFFITLEIWRDGQAVHTAQLAVAPIDRV